MFGICSRSCSSLLQGHSCRKRSATSNVAPPHISKLPAGARMCAVAGAALSMSWVRMRVAISDWWASRLQDNTGEARTEAGCWWGASPQACHTSSGREDSTTNRRDELCKQRSGRPRGQQACCIGTCMHRVAPSSPHGAQLCLDSMPAAGLPTGAVLRCLPHTHMVVSVISVPWCALTALAQPSGPSRTYTSLQPCNGWPLMLAGTSGRGGAFLAGGGPTAPGWSGPLTTCGATHTHKVCAPSQTLSGPVRTQALYCMQTRSFHAVRHAASVRAAQDEQKADTLLLSPCLQGTPAACRRGRWSVPQT